jgi:hypothetical protein
MWHDGTMSGNEGDDGYEEADMWIQKQSRYTRSSNKDAMNSQQQRALLALTCIVVVAHVSWAHD